MYKIQKKGPAEKNFGVFSPRHSQNCILIENLTHRCIQTGHFFPKSGHFFSIFKIGQGRPPHPPSYPPGCTPDILFFKCLRVLQFIFKKDYHMVLLSTRFGYIIAYFNIGIFCTRWCFWWGILLELVLTEAALRTRCS